MLLRPNDSILKFFKPFRLAIFSIQFVDSDSFSQLVRVDREASIFSMGGVWA
uniref:Uncharacterized protein n=1 Tax=Anguilla anguilla TaxID=7936 RepID=A0A0E9S7I5_ANGAN